MGNGKLLYQQCPLLAQSSPLSEPRNPRERCFIINIVYSEEYFYRGYLDGNS